MAKIMLVEDDNNLREIYEARLMAEGYDIVSARDGEEALAVAVREKPDLIISDVMMPKISGFDMLDILRSTPETKNAKVIMMTALSQAEDKLRAEKLGADRYLVKSQVTLEDVAKVAREVLAGEAGQGDTASIQPAAAPAAPAVPEPVAAAPVPTPVPDPVPAPVPVAEPAAAAPADEPASAAPAAAAPPADDATASLVAASVVQAAPPSGVTDLEPAVEAEPEEPAEPAPAAPASVEIEKTSAELWAAPEDVTAPDNPSTAAGTAAAEAKVDAAPTQSLADEEAAIAQQIESIIGKPAPEAAAPAAPATPEATETPVAEAPPVATPAADVAPATEVSRTEASEPSNTPPPSKPGGEKVIQPLNDPNKPTGPSIHELAAQEEAKEKAGGVDPNSLAL